MSPVIGQRHPGTEVQLVEDGGARLPRRLERSDVQLAVLPEGEEAFECRPLYPMHLIAVVASGHRLHRRATVELSELADEALLLLGREFASRAWFDAGVRWRDQAASAAESAVPQTLLALARDGHGVALVPSPVAVPRVGLHGLPLSHRGASVGRWAVLAWDPRRVLARHAATFVDELAAHVSVTIRGVNWCVARHRCRARRACTALDAPRGCRTICLLGERLLTSVDAGAIRTACRPEGRRGRRTSVSKVDRSFD